MAALVEGGPETPHTDKLYIFPWQVYPDMVVFDWFIRLADKDRSDLMVVIVVMGVMVVMLLMMVVMVVTVVIVMVLMVVMVMLVMLMLLPQDGWV